MNIDLQKQAYEELLQMEIKYQRKIVILMKRTLKEIREEMMNIYGKYAMKGILTKAEMTQYNRYAEMEKAILEKVGPAVGESKDVIIHMLPEQYNAAFFRTAWAIDNENMIRLAWGLVDTKKVAKLFSITNKDNEFFRNALKNYSFNSRKIIRRALEDGLAKGKSYKKMVADLTRAMDIINHKALLILRTEGQNAINAGTALAYNQAMSNGVRGKIIWDATPDTRVRLDHAMMDGRAKGDDGWYRPGPGGEDCMYPAWEGLTAKQRCNCRCRERFQVDGFTPEFAWTREQGIVPYKEYKQWFRDYIKANKVAA